MKATQEILFAACGPDRSMVILEDCVVCELWPQIEFAWGGGISEFAIEYLSSADEQLLATEKFHEAIIFLYERILFTFRVQGSDTFKCPIAMAELAGIPEEGRIRSASSPQAPHRIRFAARWTSVDIVKLASLILHESVHQLLYQRELIASPVRSPSYAYSPFKQTHREGRLVWHAFWTFGAQLGFMLEYSSQKQLSLPNYFGDILKCFSEFEICWLSIKEFDVIVDPTELVRMDLCFCKVRALVLHRIASRIFRRQQLENARLFAMSQYREWSDQLVQTAPETMHC